MRTHVMIKLPDTVYGQVQHVANMTGQSISDILATTIELSLSPLLDAEETNQPLLACGELELTHPHVVFPLCSL